MKTQHSIERFISDPDVAENDPENPDGLLLNTGGVHPLDYDNVYGALDELAIPFGDLLFRYQLCEDDKSLSSEWRTEGLFIFPKWFILFTTYYQEPTPFSVFDGPLAPDDFPVTSVEAFPRNSHGNPDKVAAARLAPLLRAKP